MTPTVDSLPPELWPLACRAATGQPWPPRTDAAADRLVAFANRHRLLPLLAASPSLPESVAAALARSRAVLRLHRVWLDKVLETMGTLFTVAGTREIVFFKGADFAFRLYDDPAFRPMADLDILVPPRAAQRLRRLLEGAGLVPQYPTAGSRHRDYHEFSFRGTGVTIDLHQAFLQRPRHKIDYDAMWSRREPLPTPAGAAFRLADPDALLALCVSAAGDYFDTSLIRFVDVHLLLRSDARLASETLSLAREWKCERAVYGMLRRYERLFPETAPSGLRASLGSMLGRRTRAFLDRAVVPGTLQERDGRRNRARELWRKFWLMDENARRAAFLAYYLRSTISGALTRLRERGLRRHDTGQAQRAG